ncbi:carbohydrate ABC transporter permease [Paenibacillus sp. J2TS4]|uniref:carbohydrate ABC transporter permease n=1 Tax=Paenibacillus sp. J2TS4 TaxID=2807194 RepID=UPI001BCAF0BD
MKQRKSRHSTGYRLRKFILPHVFLILLGLVFLFPFVWLILTSLKMPQEIFKVPLTFFPQEFQWQNYSNAIAAMPFFRFVGNSLFIASLNIIGQLFAAPLVAYSIAKIPWRGRNVVFSIIIATMILPPQVMLIPQYIIFSKLDLVNTYVPLTIGAFFGAPFYIFLLRQFLLGIPIELSEAARIDGASEFRIYWQIILPQLKPVLATIVLFTFVGAWTEFLGPLIYLTDAEKWTIMIGLQGFLQDHSAQWEQLMAAAALFTIPSVIIFFFGQKYFMEAGSAMTGLK